MLLNIKNRLILLNLLPKEGNLHEQSILKDILKKIEITGETAKLIELETKENGILTWNPEKDEVLDVSFSSSETLFLKSVIDEVDKNKKVNQENIDLLINIKSL